MTADTSRDNDSGETQDVNDVTVVGGGTMGHGIAQVFATAGFETVITDIDEDILEAAINSIKASLGQREDADVETILSRIDTTTDDQQAFAEADLIVEAVPEDIDIKTDIVDRADGIAAEDSILATNTSTLPITEIAESSDRPGNVVGMHFSNPVQVMPIVEVIAGDSTTDATVETTERLANAIGKEPIQVRKDVPGFVLNRINVRFWNAALDAVENNDTKMETVDAAIRALDFPMGPFEVMDFVGLDIVEMAVSSMRDRGVDVSVPVRLQETVKSEEYGVKTGVGFYEYPDAGQYSRVSIPSERRYDFDTTPLFAAALSEARWLVDNDVATREEIDTAMQIGMNWPQGLFRFADQFGLD